VEAGGIRRYLLGNRKILKDLIMDINGSCLCGSIEFRVHNLGNKIYQCHCPLCRKQGGSASNTGTVVPLDQLEWIKGKEKIKSWVKPTGFRSDFCTTCGSVVPNPLREFDYYWIPVGTLDDAEFEIIMSIYTNEKASWGVLAPNSEKYETMPSFEEFITLLRNDNKPSRLT
jgi:hypothetical protein